MIVPLLVNLHFYLQNHRLPLALHRHRTGQDGTEIMLPLSPRAGTLARGLPHVLRQDSAGPAVGKG